MFGYDMRFAAAAARAVGMTLNPTACLQRQHEVLDDGLPTERSYVDGR
jgi:hypothetical protein